MHQPIEGAPCNGGSFVYKSSWIFTGFPCLNWV